MKINRLKRVLFFVLLLNVCSILIIHSSSAAPPTADAGGPYTGDEGSGITVSGAGSSDPDNDIVLYEWDLDNDGQYDDATGVTATFNATDNGSFTVGLRVTDAENNMATDTATVDVTNVAPTASITGAPASSPEGTKIDLTSAVTDPSSADTAAGFTYAWSVTKNGNPFGSGSSAGFSFTPDDNATYAVTLNVTDKDNGTSPPDSKT
ncbi:PKD domain-containing protein, partial [Candidatus Poribacteria bacterium]|nr:PKD domain-containing protein [Candidatus Poribacteria bacterium]